MSSEKKQVTKTMHRINFKIPKIIKQKKVYVKICPTAGHVQGQKWETYNNI